MGAERTERGGNGRMGAEKTERGGNGKDERGGAKGEMRWRRREKGRGI